jgi:hypothetical protein
MNVRGALPAHVIVKIRPDSAIANCGRLRDCPPASAVGGRLTMLKGPS